MRTLEFSQMETIEGGRKKGCAAAIIGFSASLFGVIAGAATAVTGIGVGLAAASIAGLFASSAGIELSC